jgi:hypothetical protein
MGSSARPHFQQGVPFPGRQNFAEIGQSSIGLLGSQPSQGSDRLTGRAGSQQKHHAVSLLVADLLLAESIGVLAPAGTQEGLAQRWVVRPSE